ncbi:MAG: hypothetical protein KDA84_21595, partial [Planctomycetaceae bacterium]|nr:hypothetical protein [Planctomycetaceae bacterium]
GSRPDVVLWDVQSGKPKRQFPGHVWMVGAVAFSPDGSRLVTGGRESVNMWALKQSENPQIFERPSSLEESWSPVTLSPNGKFMSTEGLKGGTGPIWNFDSQEEEAQLEDEDTRNAAFSTDGTWYASVGYEPKTQDGRLRIRKTVDWKIQHAVTLKDDWGRGLVFSPDGKLVAVGDEELIAVVAVESGEKTLELKGHKHTVRDLAFSHDGGLLASTANDKTVRLWNLKTGKQVSIVSEDSDGSCIAFLDGGQKLLWKNREGNLILWDWEKNARAYSAGQSSCLAGGEVAVSPDGRTAVVVPSIFEETGLLLFNVAIGEPVATFPLPKGAESVDHLQFSPDGKKLMVLSSDGSRRVWTASESH